MTDDFDDAIRSRLHQPGPTSAGDAHAILDELRPAMRRARIRRSLAVGTATLSVIGLGGLGVLAVTNSVTQSPTELDILIDGDPLPNVTPAPPTTTPVPSTTEPEQDDAETNDTATATTTTTPPATTQAPTTTEPEPTAPTTAEPQSLPPTTQGQPEPSPPTTGATTPATTNPPNTTTPATTPNPPDTTAPPTTVPTSTTSSTAAPTTGAPSSGQQTIQSNCGSIMVTWTGANISLTATQPAAGFSPEIENAGPEEIKVKFDNGDAKCEIEAQIEAGTLVSDVENDASD